MSDQVLALLIAIGLFLWLRGFRFSSSCYASLADFVSQGDSFWMHK